MKLRTMAVVVLGVGLLAGAGCKKKKKEAVAPPEGSGTMMGSGSDTAMGSNAPMKEAKLEGKALADRYLECTALINGAKLEDFKSKCLAADYKGHEADGPDIAGPDAVVEYFKSQAIAFPDMKVEPQLVLVNGRNLFGVGLITGTHTGPMKTPMGEVPATNKKIGVLMFHQLAVNDENHVTEEWSYFDPMTMMGQLGLLPKEVPPMRPALDKGWEGAPVIVVAADDDKEKANLDVTKKAGDSFNTHKPADFMAFYTDDALESDQAGDKDAKGKKEIEAGAMMFLKAFTDMKIEWPSVFAAGDYVVALGTLAGTNDGPMGPMKATKKPVKGSFAEVMKLKDGKIAEVWRFRNGMAMASQLGLLPEPPKGGDMAGSGDGSAK